MYTDYSRRQLIRPVARRGELASIREIAEYYGTSPNHLMKVVHHQLQAGFVESRQVKSCGLSLARPAESICIAEVVRSTEPHSNLVECIHGRQIYCAVHDVSRLNGALSGAAWSFLTELDGYTLARVVGSVNILMIISGYQPVARIYTMPACVFSLKSHNR